MKHKVAFIDHSFHKKTAATCFLIDILKKNYEVEVFWDESWDRGPRVDLRSISQNSFNPIIFFQIVHYPEEEIYFLKDRNVIVFPMFDASPNLFDHFWRKYTYISEVKFVNFSKTLHQRQKKLGFESRYFQYFLPPDKSARQRPDPKGLKGFFWQRTNRITWNHIRELIKNTNFKSIVLHSAVDPPGFDLVLPAEEEIKKYNIKITRWFNRKEDYSRLVRDADVYFAPRAAEGIGMSFLEAMAMGKCVVAADNPTMNEYISHGKTGLLYDPDNPGPLDFSNIEEISLNAQKYIEEGRQRWLESEKELLDFIQETLKSKKIIKNLTLKVKLSFYFKFKKTLYLIKRFIKFRYPRLAKILLAIKNQCRW